MKTKFIYLNYLPEAEETQKNTDPRKASRPSSLQILEKNCKYVQEKKQFFCTYTFFFFNFLIF